MDEIKVKNEIAKQWLEAHISEAQDLILRMVHSIQSREEREAQEYLVDEYNNWVDRTKSMLRRAFVSWHYGDEFENKCSPKKEYVSSDWVAGLDYYSYRKLYPQREYLTVLLKNIDKYVFANSNEIQASKNTASSDVVKILNILETKLRKVVRDIPTKEIDIQNLVENLLVGADIQYSREKEKIEYSSKTYIPDFTLYEINAVIEVKFCDHAKREKEMISEINDDILAYGSKHNILFFVVYDIGQIRDVDKFKVSFEMKENVIVRVVKH